MGSAIAISPRDLRLAARKVIVEGVTMRMRNAVDERWAECLFRAFTEHRDELMALADQFAPKPVAEIRLLEHCLAEVETREERALIRAAIRLLSTSPVVNTDQGYLNGAIVMVERTDDWMAYVEGDTGLWDAGKTRAEAVEALLKTHPQQVAEAIQRLT